MTAQNTAELTAGRMKPMKIFHLQADIQFEALSLDHAFHQLEAHFGQLQAGVETEPWFEGEVTLELHETYVSKHLARILGGLPENARAFHIEGETLVLSMSDGTTTTVALTPEQHTAMREAGLPGSYPAAIF